MKEYQTARFLKFKKESFRYNNFIRALKLLSVMSNAYVREKKLFQILNNDRRTMASL